MPHENAAAIVTSSGGSGCGRSVSLRFANDGMWVVVSGIGESAGRETAA
jgi:hypothetical protein